MIIDLLRSNGSIVVNKNLVFSIGINEAILYSELISKHDYFANKDQLTEDGYFYNTVDNMRLDTGLGEKVQAKAIKNLKALGLIKVKLRGLPAKRHFMIIPNEERIRTLLEDGKRIRMELEEATSEKNDLNKSRLSSKINSYAQTEELVPPNGSVNNTKQNNTKKKDLKDRDQEKIPDLYISFNQFLKQVNLKGISLYEQHKYEAVKYFVNAYYENFKKEHPKLRHEQWSEAVDKMLYVYSDSNPADFDVNIDDEEKMIDSYFETFFEDCNYSILHYISGDLRSIRMFDTVY